MRNDGMRLPAWLCAGALLTGLLGACAAQTDVTVTPVARVKLVPTTLVEVLQAPPSRPYFIIAHLDASAPAGTPAAQVLASLQSKAQALGASAIIVRDLSTEQQGALQFNPTGGQFSQAQGERIPHLQADAIRYTTNP